MSKYFRHFCIIGGSIILLLLLYSCGNRHSSNSPVGLLPNRVIRINALYDTFVFVSNTSRYRLDISYNGNDCVNFIIPALPAFATFDTAARAFVFAPTVNDTGEYTIAFTVYNSDSSSVVSSSFKLDVFNPLSYSPSPTDWRKRVMYLVMVDRFNDGDSSTNAANGEYAPADKGKINGGDIQGIIDKLDYLQSLGITSLWITPVLKNKNAYHGYHIVDFKDIDPHFGTIEKLRELVSKAHQREIAVIFDVVCNHTADLISNTADVYTWNYPTGYTLKYTDNNFKHKPDYLANLDFFHNFGNIDGGWDDPIQGVMGDFFGLDDLKTENVEVQKILAYIYAWWILKTDCDGFRIDTVKHVNIEFFEYFIPYIKNVCSTVGKNNFFIFGEVWSDSDAKVGKYSGAKNNPQKYLFDSLTYFPMYFTLNDVFKNNGATNLISARRAYLSEYDATTQDQLIAFIDNHDNDRFLCKPEPRNAYNYEPANNFYYPNLKLAYTFMATYPCIPCIYYGTEQGFDGYKLSVDYGDGYVREDMWSGGFEFGPSTGDNFDTSSELYVFIKTLNDRLAYYDFIKTGAFNELYSETTAGIYAFSRYSGDSEAIVVLNTADTIKTVDLSARASVGGVYNDIFSAVVDTVTVNGSNKVAVTIAPKNYKIYVR